MKKKRNSAKRAYVTAIMAFLTFSMILTLMPIVNAAGALTLTPTVQAPGSTVTVSGTGFGANQAVGLGFGAEVNVTNENMIMTGPFDVAIGPYVGYSSYAPIKPGTFTMSINASSTLFVKVDTDFGNGTLGDPTSLFTNGTINYATGQRTRFTKSPVSSTSHFLHLINYTRYQYNVTPAAGVTTNPSGAFTASITVPNVRNGVYTITAVDTEGHIATATLTVASGGSGWDWAYGGTGRDFGAGAVIQTSDGGYALAGETASFGAGGNDFWLIKTDAAGVMLWNRTYGGAGDDRCADMFKTGGGYVMAGGTNSSGAGGYDFWLVKTDNNGNMLWNKTYGGIGDEIAFAVVQTSDGGLAIAGNTSSSGAGRDDFWLVKTDASGNMQWNKTYGGAGRDFAEGLVQTSDGGYALAGVTSSFGAGGDDCWLVKTDSAGSMLWNKTYGAAGLDHGYSLVATSDGGYAMTGYTTSFGGAKAYLVKAGPSGTMQWNKTYGGIYVGIEAIQAADGGYAIAGWNYAGLDQNFLLIKTDASGNLQWEKTYGGTGVENAYGLFQTSDGGYALLGQTNSFGAGLDDIWLVKTNDLGVVPEGFTMGVMLAMSTIAVVVSARYFRKRIKWERW